MGLHWRLPKGIHGSPRVSLSGKRYSTLPHSPSVLQLKAPQAILRKTSPECTTKEVAWQQMSSEYVSSISKNLKSLFNAILSACQGNSKKISDSHSAIEMLRMSPLVRRLKAISGALGPFTNLLNRCRRQFKDCCKKSNWICDWNRRAHFVEGIHDRRTNQQIIRNFPGMSPLRFVDGRYLLSP